MPRYLVLGHGGTPPATKQEAEAFMARWMAWFAQAGKAVADPGGPFQARATVGWPPKTTANGFMLLEAKDLESAKAIAAGCPAAAEGQGMEVFELRDMSGKTRP